MRKQEDFACVYLDPRIFPVRLQGGHVWKRSFPSTQHFSKPCQQVKCDDIGMALMVLFICLGVVSKRTEDHLFFYKKEASGRSPCLLGSLLKVLLSCYPKVVPWGARQKGYPMELIPVVRRSPFRHSKRGGVC